MKLLIENDKATGGGVENVLQNLAALLVKQGHDVTVLVMSGDEDGILRSFPPEIHCIRRYRPRKKLNKFSLAWFWDRLLYTMYDFVTLICLRAKRFNVAIAMKEGPCMKDILRFRAERYFAWVHVDYNYLHWTKNYFPSAAAERACMQRYDRVVCVSHAALEAVVSTIGDPGNLCVRYNPINAAKILELACHPCGLEKPKGRPLLVSVGRLAPPKNFGMLLRVCAKLGVCVPFDLWIIGDGPERGELEEYAQRQKMDFVHFVGQQHNPYSWMRQADVYVSSSSSESYGLAVQEALILGMPVVSVSCPAVEEVFDRRFGILTENSEEALLTGLEEMLRSKTLRCRCRENISRWFKTGGLYEERLRQICSMWE